MTIHIGCCGFARARSEYFRHFEVLEVQQTFYRLPRLATVQAWRNEAPAGFLFAMKAWQIITHPASSPTYRRAGVIPDDPADHFGFFRPTDEVFQAWSRTREIAEAVHAPVVLFQCPASFDSTDDHVANLIAFARQVDRGGLAFAWEPRGPWPDTTVRVLCAELNLLHAVDPFLRQPLTEGRAYFRLHGRTGYRYRYTDADLQQLIARVQLIPGGLLLLQQRDHVGRRLTPEGGATLTEGIATCGRLDEPNYGTRLPGPSRDEGTDHAS